MMSGISVLAREEEARLRLPPAGRLAVVEAVVSDIESPWRWTWRTK